MATTHKVEIAFATDPDAVTPTWTDVTAYVWAAAGGQIAITRGRTDQTSQITPSQLSLTLDNHDGRFTAGYTSGAYYPNVVLGKRIRVSTNTGAGFVPRFDGYVNAWPVQWAPSGRWAEAQITAVDRLARLGRQLAADNLVSTYYLKYSPSDYWMFGDAEGTLIPYNRSGAAQLKIGWVNYPTTGTVTFGTGTGPGYDGLSAMQVVDNTLSATTSPTYTFSETQSLTFMCYMRGSGVSAALGDSFSPFVFFAGTGSAIIELLVEGFVPPAEQGLIQVSNAAGTTQTTTGTANLTDGSTHHVAVVCQGLGVGSGGTILLYVDGVLDNSAAVSTALLSGGISVPLQTVATNDLAGSSAVWTVAHAAIFPSALTAPQIADVSASGLTAFQGESTLARTTRLAGLAGVTPVVTGTAGTTSMAPLLDVSNADYLSMLQSVADTEAGLLFTQCDGQVRLRPRRDMQNQATKWTLSIGQYGADITFLLDDFGVVNDVIADRPSGTPIHSTNATSVTANGTYSISTTLQTTSDNEVLDYANWTLSTGAPVIRCSQVTVNLLTQNSLVSTWLTMELGDVIACTGLPSTSAPATSVTMQVQGWTETIALDTYQVQMNTTPYDSGSIFIFDDTTFGKFNGPGVFGY